MAEPTRPRDARTTANTGPTTTQAGENPQGEQNRPFEDEEDEAVAVPKDKGKQRAMPPPTNVMTGRMTRSKSRNEGRPTASETAVVDAAQTMTKTREKARQERRDEENRDRGEYNRPSTERQRAKQAAEHPSRPSAEASTSRQAASTIPEDQQEEEDREEDLVNAVNASLEYLHESQKKLDKYRTLRVREDERFEEMVEISGSLLRGITKAIKKLNLPAEEEERVLGPFKQIGKSPNDRKSEEREETQLTEDDRGSGSQARHGKDRETRLREAGLGDAPAAGRDDENHDDDRRDRGRRENTARSDDNGDRGDRRQVRGGAGGPPDGDDDGSSSDEGADDRRDNRDEREDRNRRRRDNSRRRDTSRHVGMNDSRGRRRELGAGSISMAQPYSAALPIVDRTASNIMRIIERVIESDTSELPPVIKQYKPTPPETYNGEDNVNVYFGWLQNLARYYWIVRLVGAENDELRVYAVGDALGGEAKKWYLSEVMGPNRQKWDWTFLEIILELNRRFVRQATVQLATENYHSVEFKASTGVSGLYTEMMKYATQMVEHPGEYAFRRKFLQELPDEMSNTIMRSRKMTAETHTMDEILEEALAIENADKTARIFHKHKAGRSGNSASSNVRLSGTGGNPRVVNANSTTNRSMVNRGGGRFVRRNPMTTRVEANKSATRDNANNDIAPTGGSASAAGQRQATAPITRRTTERTVDMSKIQCFKCKEFGHYASAHDRGELRAMDVETAVDEGETESSEDTGEGAPPEEEGLEGEQYNDVYEDELEAYEMEDQFYDAEGDELTFAPMRVEDDDEDDIIAMDPSEVDQEESEDELHEVMHDEEHAPLVEGHPEHDAEAMRLSIRGLNNVMAQFLMNDHIDANPRREPIEDVVVDDRARLYFRNRVDEEHVEFLSDAVMRLMQDVHGMRTDLMHIWWAMDNGASTNELANIVARTRRREERRVTSGRESLSGRLSEEAAFELRDTQSRHRNVLGNRPTVFQLAARQLMTEIEEEMGPNVTDDDMPGLVDLNSDGEEVPVANGTARSDASEGNSDSGSDHASVDLRGMRTVEAGPQLNSMSEVQGQRAAMRVTSQSHPRPSNPSTCMTIHVMVNGLKGVALIDTGSSINAISPAFACVANLEAFPLEKPVGLQLGCVGSRSKINYGMNQRIQMEGIEITTYFDVVNLDHYDLVLGIPFLRTQKVVLHFGEGSLRVGSQDVPTLTKEERRISNNARERAKRGTGPRTV